MIYCSRCDDVLDALLNHKQMLFSIKETTETYNNLITLKIQKLGGMDRRENKEIKDQLREIVNTKQNAFTGSQQYTSTRCNQRLSQTTSKKNSN